MEVSVGSAGRVSVEPLVTANGRVHRVTDPDAAVRRDATSTTVAWADGLRARITSSAGVLALTLEATGACLDVSRAGVHLRRDRASTRILVDGYQSWDWAGVRDATRWGRGWWGAIWGSPGATDSLAIGLAEPPTLGVLELEWDGAGGLEAALVGTPQTQPDRTGPATSLRLRLEPGCAIAVDPIRLCALDPAHLRGDGLPTAKGVAPAPREAGWMSWNALGGGVTAVDAVAAIPLTPPGGLVLVDDGWMRRWGDWTPHEAFGSPLHQLAVILRRADRRLGVWLAPFLAAPDSDVATGHPDWLLRDPVGKPVEDHRSGRRMLVLDASLPEVQAHLAALGSQLAGSGVRTLKLDYLYAGGLPGVRDGRASDIAALRAGLRSLADAFRAASPPGVVPRVYACGAPGPAVVGLVDACRSGNDSVIGVGQRDLRGRVARWLGHLWGRGLVESQLRNLAARAWLWGAALPPDADAVSLGRLSLHRVPDSATVSAATGVAVRCGGPALDSDNPRRPLPAARRTELRRLWTVSGQLPLSARIADPFAGRAVPMRRDVFTPTREVHSATAWVPASGWVHSPAPGLG